MGRTNRYNPEMEDKQQGRRKKKGKSKKVEEGDFKPKRKKRNKNQELGDYEDNFEKFKKDL